MTEQEWLTSLDPLAMLERIRWKASQRKLRLFAVACCRSIWDLVPTTSYGFHVAADARIRPGVNYRKLVETAEQYADGNATADELDAADFLVVWAGHDMHNLWWASEDAAAMTTAKDAFAAAYWAPIYAATAKEIEATLELDPTHGPAYEEERKHQSNLLRDILGNPFHRTICRLAWRTATVMGLAHVIYNERGFERLPIFADALEEAGCDSADILAHLRLPGPHTRGCWPLDLVLGRK